MAEYKMRIKMCDWYGGDRGYGVPRGDVETIVKEFDCDTEALSWAYDYAESHSQLKAPRTLPKTLCEIAFDSDSLHTDEGTMVNYDIQYIFKFQKWYVFTRFKSEPYVKAYRLHKDGTLGCWNGIY